MKKKDYLKLPPDEKIVYHLNCIDRSIFLATTALLIFVLLLGICLYALFRPLEELKQGERSTFLDLVQTKDTSVTAGSSANLLTNGDFSDRPFGSGVFNSSATQGVNFAAYWTFNTRATGFTGYFPKPTSGASFKNNSGAKFNIFNNSAVFQPKTTYTVTIRWGVSNFSALTFTSPSSFSIGVPFGFLDFSFVSTYIAKLGSGQFYFYVEFPYSSPATSVNIEYISIVAGSQSDIGDQLYQQGYQDGYNEGKQTGQEIGYNYGITDGYNQGYENGKTAGYNDGYNKGYGVGKSDGQTAGYNQGYSDGLDKGTNLWGFISSVGAVPLSFIQNMLNFELFGINMSDVVLALLSTALVVILLKLFVR